MTDPASYPFLLPFRDRACLLCRGMSILSGLQHRAFTPSPTMTRCDCFCRATWAIHFSNGGALALCSGFVACVRPVTLCPDKRWTSAFMTPVFPVRTPSQPEPTTFGTVFAAQRLVMPGCGAGNGSF